ncbi:MAG TPA: tetratricopeptide repeat protein [Thermoanaerobaculia bacterium]|jgi:tetratricopeptide (TPR) repeat protein|nr:tetratricopeptide repeat protein [Thermoanaerobaculia bacterium]
MKVCRVLLVSLLFATASFAAEDPAAKVPSPDLAGLEPAVAAQLQAGREALVARLADKAAKPDELAEAWGGQGQLYHAYGLFDAAVVCYREAAALQPKELRWPYLLGQAERARSELAAARVALQTALAIAPYPPALVALGEMDLAEGDSTGAAEAAQRALALVPKDAAALAVLGQAKLSQRDFKGAAEALEAALVALPQADRLHYPLALAYRGLGDEERAKQELARVGRTGARTADPLLEELDAARTGELAPLLRARRAAAAGDWKSAAAELRRALAANPKSVRANVDLGAALANLGDASGARAALEAALAGEPSNMTAHFNLGVLLLGAGDAAAALPHLEAVVAAKADDVDAQRSLGDALLALGRPADALPHYRAAIAAADLDEPSRFGEAVALLRMGKLAEARDRLEKAYQVMPEQGRLTHLLARLLAADPDLSRRNGARAVELANAVWQAQPDAAHGRTLALALAEAGRCADAAKLATALADKVAPEERGELEAAAKSWAAGPPCRPAAPAQP